MKQQVQVVLLVLIVLAAMFLLFVSQNPQRRIPSPADLATRSVNGASGRSGDHRDARGMPGRGVGRRRRPRKHPGAGAADLNATNGVPRDAIADEYVLRFFDEGDRAAFIKLAKERGINVLGSLGLGHAVRIKVADRRQFEKLLADGPTPVDYGFNYYVYSPERPVAERPPPKTPYVGFGGQALPWLGVPPGNGTWGKGITVAILDTGVQPHVTLLENRITRMDLVGDGDEGSGDARWHGTAVASLLAGNSPDLRGVVPGVDILSIKTLSSSGDGDSFTIAEGIVEAVDRGAKIVNLCLGTYGNSFILKEAVIYALQNGAVVVAATGNDSSAGLLYPARYEGVLAVSGVDAMERHVYFANSGPEVDLAAPALGLSAAWEDNGLALFSGTSAAVPFVSGAVARLLSEDPDLTPSDVANLLSTYANDAESPGRDEWTGDGVLSIQRLEERHTAGLYDVAVGNPYVRLRDEEDATYVVVGYVQNRGTEVLSTVDLEVTVGGEKATYTFYNMKVGQVISRDCHMNPELFQSGTVTVTVRAAIRGRQDAYPVNNVKTSTLALTGEE